MDTFNHKTSIYKGAGSLYDIMGSVEAHKAVWQQNALVYPIIERVMYSVESQSPQNKAVYQGFQRC